MYNAFLMRIIERKADLDNDRNRISPVEVSVLIDEVFYRNAFNIFLYDVTELAFMAYAEDFNDI